MVKAAAEVKDFYRNVNSDARHNAGYKNMSDSEKAEFDEELQKWNKDRDARDEIEKKLVGYDEMTLKE